MPIYISFLRFPRELGGWQLPGRGRSTPEDLGEEDGTP